LEKAMTKLFFMIQGQPVAKGRPRFTRSGRTYTPAKTAKWADMAAYIMRETFNGDALGGPIKLEIIAVFQRPKNRFRRRDPFGRYWHTHKPDKDNVEKNISDALQKAGVITNDSCICTGQTSKYYASKNECPCVIVYLEQIAE